MEVPLATTSEVTAISSRSGLKATIRSKISAVSAASAATFPTSLVSASVGVEESEN